MTDGGARAKGSAVQATLAFVSDRLGPAKCDAVLAALPEADRAALARLSPTDEVPYALLVTLWDAVDAAWPSGGADDDWAAASGEESIASFGVQLYGGILRKPTPREFLTQSISLFRLYYQPGDMEVVVDEPGRAVLRLVGFDPVTRIFCRRQRGGLRRAIALAGGDAPRVRHVRCVIDGDAFCEWELQWNSEPPPAGARGAT